MSAYDADTITVDIDLGFGTWLKNQTIRLFRIDAPELRGDEREQGLVARDYLRSRLEKADTIMLHTHKDKKGKYGRWLAEVYIGDENINQTLIAEGLAKDYIL